MQADVGLLDLQRLGIRFCSPSAFQDVLRRRGVVEDLPPAVLQAGLRRGARSEPLLRDRERRGRPVRLPLHRRGAQRSSNII